MARVREERASGVSTGQHESRHYGCATKMSPLTAGHQTSSVCSRYHSPEIGPSLYQVGCDPLVCHILAVVNSGSHPFSKRARAHRYHSAIAFGLCLCPCP